MTLKTLIDEFRSRKPEAVIADGLIRQGWFVLFACFALVYGVVSNVVRKYIPSIRPYLTSGLPWIIGAACILVSILIFHRFTNWGRRRRLFLLIRLIRRYSRFSHEKEMEVVSRIHSRTRAAALVFLMTLHLAFPLAIAIIYLFGVAIISDVTNNIKGTHIHPSFGPKLLFNVYGVVLGLSFSWMVILLESARLESLLLSAKYRRKMIVDWQARIVKLKSKLCKQTHRKALVQSASAST